METLKDVIHWFEDNKFIINPLVTIIVIGGVYYAPRILAILIQNDKNDPKSSYTSKQTYINYLKD